MGTQLPVQQKNGFGCEFTAQFVKERLFWPPGQPLLRAQI
jgi:hypothetical protein